jgi:hypothetical protein
LIASFNTHIRLLPAGTVLEAMHFGIASLDTHIRGKISDKHVSSTVCNGKGHFTFHENALWSDTTRMEDRNLKGTYINGVTPFWLVNILNADSGGAANANRSTMSVSVLGCNLYMLGELQSMNRFHGYHHVSTQATRRAAFEIGVIHGDVFTLISTLQRNAGIQESSIVRKATSNQEGNRFFRPVVSDISYFFLELSISVNRVSVFYRQRRGNMREYTMIALEVIVAKQNKTT